MSTKEKNDSKRKTSILSIVTIIVFLVIIVGLVIGIIYLVKDKKDKESASSTSQVKTEQKGVKSLDKTVQANGIQFNVSSEWKEENIDTDTDGIKDEYKYYIKDDEENQVVIGLNIGILDSDALKAYNKNADEIIEILMQSFKDAKRISTETYNFTSYRGFECSSDGKYGRFYIAVKNDKMYAFFIAEKKEYLEDEYINYMEQILNKVVYETGKNDESNKKASVENILIEKAGITNSGDFVVKVTNNNSKAVCLSGITVNFMDQDGTFQLSEHSYQSFICIPAGGTTYVYLWNYDKDYNKYPEYEFKTEFANIADNFVYNGIDIQSTNTGEQIAVTLTNNSMRTIEYPKVVVVYYKNGTIVGVEEGTSNVSSGKISNGAKAYLNVDYAKDSNYNNVSFDKYEVYYISAEIAQ